MDTGSKKVRSQYAARAAALRDERRGTLRAAQVDAIEVSTAEPYVTPLLAYFNRLRDLARRQNARFIYSGAPERPCDFG